MRQQFADNDPTQIPPVELDYPADAHQITPEARRPVAPHPRGLFGEPAQGPRRHVVGRHIQEHEHPRFRQLPLCVDYQQETV